LFAGRGGNQLHTDPECIANPLYVALHRIAHTEIPPHLPDIGGSVAVTAGGGMGDDERPRQMREIAGQVVRETLHQIIFGWVVAQILKRQYDNRQPRERVRRDPNMVLVPEQRGKQRDDRETQCRRPDDGFRPSQPPGVLLSRLRVRSLHRFAPDGNRLVVRRRHNGLGIGRGHVGGTGHRRHQAITTAGDRLDAASFRPSPVQETPQSRHLNRQVVFFDRDVRPDRVHHLSLPDKSPAAFDQHAEYVPRARAERNSHWHAAGVQPKQGPGIQIQQEVAKPARDLRGTVIHTHLPAEKFARSALAPAG
jgi:hypothetical protein